MKVAQKRLLAFDRPADRSKATAKRKTRRNSEIPDNQFSEITVLNEIDIPVNRTLYRVVRLMLRVVAVCVECIELTLTMLSFFL